MSLPDYNFLPAPLWLITTLHIVTLTLHLAAMNFLFGGIVVALFGKIEDRWANPVVQRLVDVFPAALAATVTLGVAPLLFVQLVYHRQVYAASIVSAWPWLTIFAAVIVAYYLLYASYHAGPERHTRKRVFLMVSLVLLAYVSLVYSSVFSMSERLDLYRGLYAANQSGAVINTAVGSWIFRWLHMVAGAVTVGGFFVAWLGKNNKQAYEAGWWFFLWGMITTMVFGTLFLLTLGDNLQPLMASKGIWVLAVAIVFSLGSLHFTRKKKFVPGALMLFASIVGMVTVRHVLRLIVLDGSFDPNSIPVRPQWTVFLIFLVFFVIAIALVGYMIRLFLAGNRRPEH